MKHTPITVSASSRKLPPASPVFVSYWKFAEERQRIFFRRLRGDALLTTDSVLAKYRFTNAYRASDRVSQYLIRHVIYTGDQSFDEVFFRTLLFKLFNRIATWELLTRELGPINYRTFSVERYSKILDDAMRRGERIYSAAYIMPMASGMPGKRKHETHLRLLQLMMQKQAAAQISDKPDMASAFRVLRQYPMMGEFLAYQYITDLNYSSITRFSEMDFVVAGPGARDGIRKCFPSLNGWTENDIIRSVTDHQDKHFAELGISFSSLWGRPLQLIDCQNLFCEISKYARVAHPDILGNSGRTKIKQNFTINPEPLECWYPPKWELNQKCSTPIDTPFCEDTTPPLVKPCTSPSFYQPALPFSQPQ